MESMDSWRKCVDESLKLLKDENSYMKNQYEKDKKLLWEEFFIINKDYTHIIEDLRVIHHLANNHLANKMEQYKE